MKNENINGFAISCTEEGIIQQILYDNNILPDETVGKLLSALTKKHFSDILDLIVELKTDKEIKNKRQEITLKNEKTIFYICGKSENKNLIICGGQELSDIQNLYKKFINEDADFPANSENTENTDNKSDDTYYIDELTKMNNELANMQRELVKKNHKMQKLIEKNKFLMNMATHDLYNPVVKINKFADLLANRYSSLSDAKKKDFIQIIFSASEMAMSLLDDLKSNMRLETENLKLYYKNVDLVHFLKANINENRFSLNERGIHIKLQHDKEMIKIPIDPLKIGQVMNNLIQNAARFSDAGSIITILVKTDDGKAIVTVSDEGVGIHEEDLKNIFEPFISINTDERGNKGNMGLGLMIARKIVKAHKGKIWVESQYGKGTSFHFTLPLTL